MDIQSFYIGYQQGALYGPKEDDPNIAYGETPPEDTSKLWVKAPEVRSVIVSPEKVYGEDGQAESIESFVVSTYDYRGRWVAVGTDIYIFGGRTAGSSSGKTVIYKLNTVTRSLTTLTATLPTGLTWQATAVYGTKIYLFGGRTVDYGGSGSLSASIVEFDYETLEIKKLEQSLPQAVGGACCAVVGSKAYIFGGDIGTGNQSYGTQVNYVFVFDLETHDVRYSNEQLPVVAGFMSCCAVADKIYLFGGISKNNGQKTIRCYNTADETFGVLSTTLPENRHVMGCAKVNDKICLVGGNSSYYPNVGAYVNTIWYFDPETHQITVGPTLKSSPYASSANVTNAVAVGTKIYGRFGQNGTTQGQQVIYEFAPELGDRILTRNTLQIYPAWETNVFNILNTDRLRLPIGVDMVHRGNENNISVPVEAALYKDGEWVPI